MLRTAKYVAVIVFVLAVALLAKAGLPAIATGTWQSAGQMSIARSDAASVLLPDGHIMIIGGTDANGNPLATTEFFDTDGNFMPGPTLNVARAGHAAIWLANGEVLVTGGTTSAVGVTPPAVTNSAEVFDPLYPQNGWTQIATMPNARTGHTTTMLLDGSVLIAGGENGGGPVSALDILEIAPTEHFVSAGSLLTPRRGHAAAALSDGRVLIVGGTDMSGATLAATEIFNPNALADTSMPLVAVGPFLGTPRSGCTATALIDGRVLIAGGSYPETATQTNADGSTTQTGPAELASMEVYDPVEGSMTASSVMMSTARYGHQAFLLPDNNNVLIVGGTYNGQALASVDIYSPWQNTLVATSAMANARAEATGSAMNTPLTTYPVSGIDGVLLIAGGSNQQSAEVYGFATVKTDRNDYAPGEVVTITGSGWTPYETVTLKLTEYPSIDSHGPFTVTADANGNITNTEFTPDANDFAVRFYLTAIGATSGVQAQNTFTDQTINTDILLTFSKTFVQPSTSSVLLTATLTEHQSGNPVTGKTIDFERTPGKTSICSATTNTSGVASCTLDPSSLSQNLYSIKANFGGDSTYGLSNNTQSLYVDGTAPNTSITSSPSNPSNSSSAAFGFSGSDNYAANTGNVLTFECQLDGAGFSACTNPQTYSSLGAGSHTFQVRAIDSAGNVDPTPASYTWTVSTDSIPPTTTATPTGTAGSNGWYTSDVQLALNSTDNAGGSGVKQVTYSATGAQPIGITTVSGSSVSFTMNTEGTTTVTYYATDNAGGSETAKSITIKIDKTKPVVTLGACTGTNGALVNGTQWYVSAVSCAFTASDAVSHLADASRAAFNVTSGTSEGAGITISSGQICDVAGNCADNVNSSPFAIELTALQIAFGSQSPAANQNGWNNSDVSFSYSVTNSPVSGIDTANSTPNPVVIKTEGNGVTGSVTVRTLAGNSVTSSTPAVNIDKTAPSITYVNRTAANGAEWNKTDVTVNWTCSDSLSGPVSSSVSQAVTSEGVNQSAAGTCHDLAGNSATDTQTGINIDKTAPSIIISPNRGPDHSDWYNKPVTFSAGSSTDSLSGIATCDKDVVYNEDNASASLTFHCTDIAGNTGNGSVSFKYDATPPTGVSGAPIHGPDHNGWYNTSVEVEFAGTDNVSGIANCSKLPYAGPDSLTASAQGTCTDNAGNTSASVSSASFQHDGTAPSNVALAVTNGLGGANGWYTSPVTIHTSGSFSVSGGTCTADQSQTAETKGASFNGSCTSGAGLTTDANPINIKLDMTPPTAELAVTSGKLGNDYWYVSNVAVSTTGADSISSPVTCSAVQTFTSDTTGISVYGSCTNDAGLTANATSITIKIDQTPPTVVITPDRATNSNGWYNHQVTFTNPGTDGTSGIASCTVPTAYAGPDNATASLSATCTDRAGNVGSGSFSFKYDATAPSVTCTQASFTLNQPNAAVSANVSDSLSGPVTPVSTLVTDAAIGTFSTTLTGYDLAGNSANQTCTYSVNFGKAIGFFQPWAAPPGTAFKAGSTIPLKWQWTDYYGKAVNSSAAVPDVYQDTWCAGSATASVITLDDAGASGYQYDPTTFTWQYNWKTPKNGTGLCYALNVKAGNAGGFVDGDKAVQLR